MTGLMAVYAFVALLDWYAVWREKKRLEYIAKPGALLVLCVGFGVALPSYPPPAGALFLLGLALSLAGDVFLMLPPLHFPKGLGAFLLAHLAYITAYNLGGVPLNSLTLGLAVLPLGAAIALVRPIVRALRERGSAALVAPVSAYAVVLALTLWSTLATLVRPDWPLRAALPTALGGLLFFTSDSLLAWNRFVRPIRGGPLIVIIAYHLAQALLAMGFLLMLGLF